MPKKSMKSGKRANLLLDLGQEGCYTYHTTTERGNKMLHGLVKDSAVIGTYRHLRGRKRGRKASRGDTFISYQQQADFYFVLLCKITGQTQHLTKK